VYKLGGHARVSSNNLWRQVALKLGFETTWCANQVRVHYKRYLQSFEELYRTLGCTMLQYPKAKRSASGASGGSSTRVQIRGKHRSGGTGSSGPGSTSSAGGGKAAADSSSSNVDFESDKSSVGSQDEKALMTPLETEKLPEDSSPPIQKEAATAEPVEKEDRRGKGEKSKQKEQQPETEVVLTSSPPPPTATAAAADTFEKAREKAKMTTRPRRDSTSSLAAAIQAKAQKEAIGGEENLRKPVVRMERERETENEARKLQAKSPTKVKEEAKVKAEPKVEPKGAVEVESQEQPPLPQQQQQQQPRAASPAISESGGSSSSSRRERSSSKKKVSASSINLPLPSPSGSSSAAAGAKKEESKTEEKPDEKQYLGPAVSVAVGDKIKVFYKFDTIYEAKVIRMKEVAGDRWPKYMVHYQGCDSPMFKKFS
jgi:hypothetical protein